MSYHIGKRLICMLWSIVSNCVLHPGAHSPHYTWVPTALTTPGCRQPSLHLGADSPHYTWVPTVLTTPGCRQPSLHLGADSPHYTWVPTVLTTPGSSCKLIQQSAVRDHKQTQQKSNHLDWIVRNPCFFLSLIKIIVRISAHNP